MTEKNYVTYGNCSCGCSSSGASKEITGCRFSLAPMADRYVEIILGAIQKVDTSKVFTITDKLSTVYRGNREHVIDAVKACFVHAWEKDVHMTMEATISKGCPGDTDGESVLTDDHTLVNEEKIKDKNFKVISKISLYPMGIEDYMHHIANVVNEAVDRGIYLESGHYVTILEGDVQDIFDYLSYATQYCTENLDHYIMQVTLSVNSPTK